jgi:hypothetical protein
MPNMRAEKSKVMTPVKNETFSRVRTTFAECQDADNVVIRFATWKLCAERVSWS